MRESAVLYELMCVLKRSIIEVFIFLRLGSGGFGKRVCVDVV